MQPFAYTIGFSIAFGVLAIIAVILSVVWWSLELKEDQIWTILKTGTPGTDAYKKAQAELLNLKDPENITFYGAAIAGGLASVSLIGILVAGIAEGLKA